MKIQINTDRHIDGHESLSAWVSSSLESELIYVSEHITRLEVHLSDENSADKDGPHDMRCLMEARLRGRQPIAVDHQAANVSDAVDGAADKLGRKIHNLLGKQRDQHRRSPQSPLSEQELASEREFPKHV